MNKNLKPAITKVEKRLIKGLKKKISDLQFDLNEIVLRKELNPEDHPVQDGPTEKEKRKLRKQEKELKEKQKNAKKLVNKVRAGNLSKEKGGSGRGGSAYKGSGRGGGGFRTLVDVTKGTRGNSLINKK